MEKIEKHKGAGEGTRSTWKRWKKKKDAEIFSNNFVDFEYLMRIDVAEGREVN